MLTSTPAAVASFCCRYALNTLMNIFHTSRLPTGLKQDTLARMVRTLLLRLVDDNLGKQPEGEALLKVRGVRTTP